MGLLDEKVAVITGAGGGIGRCHALAFAHEGAKVLINDVGGAPDGVGAGQAMADAVVAEIREAGGTAAANYDSVADPAGAERIIQTALDEFGRLDILVNNAGILRDKSLAKMGDDMWRAVVAVHLDGTFYCGRAAARYMKENKIPGRIINTSSLAGLSGNFGQSNYSAAKAGIVGLTLTWAIELAKYGITVNVIAPLAKTRLTEGIDLVPDDLAPETVSPVAVFLAGDLASNVNGRIFGIHGTHLFEYKMGMSQGVKKDSAWTPQEIAEKLDEISDATPPSASS